MIRQLLLIVTMIVMVVGCQSMKSSSESDAEDQVWQYIPSDTLMVFASLKPFPYKQRLAGLKKLYTLIPVELFEKLLPMSSINNQGLRFLYVMVLDNLKKLIQSEPSEYLRYYGVADQSKHWFYTVDGVPVFRSSVGNVQNLRQALNDLEKKAGVSGKKETKSGYEIRRYAFAEKADLLLATNNQALVVTIDLYHHTQFLPIVLNVEKPSNAFQRKQLEKLAKSYKMLPEAVGFFNTTEIFQQLNENKGQMASLFEVLKRYPEMDELVKALRTSKCKKYFNRQAGRLARVISGNRRYESNESSILIDAATVYESTDKAWINELKGIRGFLPTFVKQDNTLFSLAVGIDVDRYYANAGKDDIPVDCDIATNTLVFGALGMLKDKDIHKMVKGLPGIQGVSFALFDAELPPSLFTTSIKALDAILVVSTSNPAKLIKNIPGLPPIPTDGSDFTLPIPNVPNPVKLSIKGNHFVIFSGSQAEKHAASLSGVKLDSNGLAYMSIDLKRIFSTVNPLLNMPLMQNYVKPMESLFNNLSKIGIKMDYSTDVTSKGVIEETTIKMKFNK